MNVGIFAFKYIFSMHISLKYLNKVRKLQIDFACQGIIRLENNRQSNDSNMADKNQNIGNLTNIQP